MIKFEIDINDNKKPAVLKVSGARDDIALEFFSFFDELDKNMPELFRAALFAYINTNEDVKRDYERVSDSPLTKLVKDIIKESPE